MGKILSSYLTYLTWYWECISEKEHADTKCFEAFLPNNTADLQKIHNKLRVFGYFDVKFDTNSTRNFLKLMGDANQSNVEIWILSAELESLYFDIETAVELISGLCKLFPNSFYVWLKAIDIYTEAIEESNEITTNETTIKTAYLMIDGNIGKVKKIDVKDVNYDIPSLWNDKYGVFSNNFLSKYDHSIKNDLKSLIAEYPLDHRLWLFISILENENENNNFINETIDCAFLAIADFGIEIDRVEWIKTAMETRLATYDKTRDGIMNAVIGVFNENDRILKAGIEDIEYYTSKREFQSAALIYNLLFQKLPNYLMMKKIDSYCCFQS